MALMLATILLSVASTVLLYRALERRARRRAARAQRALLGTLRDFLDGTLPARALRRAVATADAATVWAALETVTLRLERDRWLQLSRALEHDRHARAERRALRDDAPGRRELAARRLGLLRSPASLRVLRRALVRGPEPVTAAAARALARNRDDRALAWLLRHPMALGRRNPAMLTGLLRGFGRRAWPALVAALEQGRLGGGRLERAAIETLGLARERPARAALERGLGSRDVEVRVAAARALGRLGAAESTGPLLASLEDEAWPVRAQAAHSLGLLGAEGATRALAARLADPSWWVRRHTAHALLALGEEGRLALREAARGSADRYARDMARAVLERTRRRESA